MNRISRHIIFFILIGLSYPSISYGAWIWTPETGRWINPKHAVKDTAEEQFKWAMSLYNSKDYKSARAEFEKLVRFYPNSTYAAKAQYYTGRVYEDMEEYYHAYMAYQKVIEAYPYAKNRDEIIKRQYEIGVLFYNGQKAKILGVALLPATDKAIEIFEEVVKNSPYGEYADKAQFKVGEAYKKSNRFAEATIAFQKLVDEYPASELLDKANYQIAECVYLASLGSSYDQQPTDLAIEKFEDFAKSYKESSFSERAKDTIKNLKEKKAESLYETARFYEKLGRRQSAALYYKELVDSYPESSLADESLSRYMEIEKGSARSIR